MSPIARAKDILAAVEALAPAPLAESWDRVGLQVGDPLAPVRRVLVALTVSLPVVEEAAARDCQMILAHHPVIFRPVAAVRHDDVVGRVLIRAVQLGLTIAVAHTNLDKASGGLNDWLAAALHIDGAEPFPTGGEGAFARIGNLQEPLPLHRWAAEVRGRLGLSGVRYVGEPDRLVRRVVTAAGAGADLVVAAAASGADCLVTGDVKFHQACDAEALGLAVVDAGHFGTESMMRTEVVSYLNRYASERGWQLEAMASHREGDPFRYLPD